MFEQTLLTNEVSARKTSAIAVSAMAQIAIGGVVVIAPLVYTQSLPFMAAKLPEFLFVLPATPPPPVQAMADRAYERSSGSERRMFVPTSIPKGPIRTTPEVGEMLDTLPEVVASSALTGVIFSGASTVAAPIAVAAPPVDVPAVVAAPKGEITKPVRISGGVLAAKLITQIVPKYPPLARQTRTSGTVRLLGIITREGSVRDLRVVDGPPLLRQAALDAVSQWIYAPTLLGGQAVEVEAPIEVHFQLN